MKRVCRDCGAAVPEGHTSCPLCGKVAPPPDAAPDVSRDVAALAREAVVRRAETVRAGATLKLAEAALFVLAVPVVLPGFAVTALMVRRWGRVPLSLVLGEGVLLTGLSYLSFEGGEGPLAGLVFPLMLLSCFACAALYVLRAWERRLEAGILLGYSGLVLALMMAGGGFLYGGAGLVLHRVRAPRFLPIASDVPRTLAPSGALRRPELIAHLILQDARLDLAKAAWRIGGGGIDVFCLVSDADREARAVPAPELLRQSAPLLGSRVRLDGARTPGQFQWIPDDWRGQAEGTRGRWWGAAAGTSTERIYLVSSHAESKDDRKAAELADGEEPEGILAEVPGNLLESVNGLDVRGRRPGDAKGLVLVPEAAPRRWCAPVEGTSGALWVQTEGDQAPEEGAPLQGVMEWPAGAAGRSLAALLRREYGGDAPPRARVLVLGTVHSYRHANGLTTEAAEGIPLGHWGSLLLGALLTALGAALSLRE